MTTTGREIAKVAALVAGGVVVGAGLGLLFAPQSGVETRRTLGRYARRAHIRATRLSRAVKSGVTEAIERGKQLLQKRDEKPVVEAA